MRQTGTNQFLVEELLGALRNAARIAASARGVIGADVGLLHRALFAIEASCTTMVAHARREIEDGGGRYRYDTGRRVR